MNFDEISIQSSGEVSSDLLTWSSGRKHITVVISDSTTLKIRDNTPVTRDDKRHIRLQP